MRTARLLVAASLLLGSTATLPAQVSFVSSRAAIGGSTLDWFTLYGFPGAVVPTTPVATGIPGLTIQTTGGVQQNVFQQGVQFVGNFSPGDPVLVATPSPLTFLFNTDILSFGTQVQGLAAFGSFIGTITAYDSFGTSLGSFNLPGVSSGDNDGSAIFMGITSATGMRSVSFEISGSPGSPIAVNEATFETMPTTSVPEPASFALVTVGLAGVGFFARRRVRTC